MCFYENLFRIHKINFKTYSSRNTRDVTDYTHYSGLLTYSLLPTNLDCLANLHSLSSLIKFLPRLPIQIFWKVRKGFLYPACPPLPAIPYNPLSPAHRWDSNAWRPASQVESTKPPPALLPELPTRLPTVKRCSEDQCGVILHIFTAYFPQDLCGALAQGRHLSIC